MVPVALNIALDHKSQPQVIPASAGRLNKTTFVSQILIHLKEIEEVAKDSHETIYS